MERTYAADVKTKINEKILLQGFVENIRNGKSMAFIVIKDMTGKVQITVEKEKSEPLCPIVDQLTPDSVVSVTGTVLTNEYVKLNGVELLPDDITIESLAAALPIVRKEIPGTNKKKGLERSGIDQRMDYRWIDLRTDENLLLFQIQTTLVNAMRDYLLNQSFLEIHSPKLIGAASESGSDVFEVKYFEDKAYLAQSPQFYKQMAMAGGFEKIFEVGPVFRAEKSYTNKHTTEYTSFDLETSYIKSYRDVMEIESRLLIYAWERIKEKYGTQINELYGTEVVVPEYPFPVVTLAELYDGLFKEYGYEAPERERDDLSTEAERLSCEWSKKIFNHEFLFVTDFGAAKRAFYHMRDEKGVPQGFDLIWRGVEITTGAQREHRYDRLREQAREIGLDKDVEFYLEFFKYGCPPHGGFAIGVDRLTMLIAGLHIKDAMFLFRSPNRLTP